MKRMSGVGWGAGAAVAGLAVALAFGPQMRADEDGQGPARAVRLSSVDGQVQLTQGGQSLADHALANTPLFEGTVLTTGDDGRAEIQFEDGSVARIPPDSSLTLSALRPGQTELTLNSGMGYFELQGAGQDNSMRVRFGNSVVTGSGFTVLRLKLDQAPGELAVFSGNAHIDGEGGMSLDLHGGEAATPSATNAGEFNVAGSIEPDSWDAWNSDRDQALTAEETNPTPATDSLPQNNNPAWGDLNANGSWYNVPDQGYVWSPYEASNPGWDPFGMGYWMWTPRFGYVWVSGERWGYMPYQCGAWNYYDAFGWGWAPGGCQTWWGGGGGGDWYFTVGTAPRWYKLPVRPGPPRPRDPHPVERDPITRGRAVGPAPVITVNRRIDYGAPLPPRDRGTQVNLGGRVVEPLASIPTPMPSRLPIDRQPAPRNRVDYSQQPDRGVAGRSGYVRAPDNNGQRRQEGSAPPARPVTSWPAGGSIVQPAPQPAPPPRTIYTPRPSEPSGGRSAPAPRSSPPPASHSDSKSGHK